MPNRRKKISRAISKAGKGELIHQLREKSNMSQTELARKLRLSQGTISNLETGKSPVSIDLAKRLGKVFKTSARKFEPRAS